MKELIDQYEAGGPQLSLAIRGLQPEDMVRPCEPGRWSIQQVVIHLADTEMIFAERIKRIIAEDNPRLIVADENRWVERLAIDAQSAEDAAALTELTRRQMTRILRAVPADAWARTGEHSVAGPITVTDAVRKCVNHLEHHLKFIHGKRATMGKEMW